MTIRLPDDLMRRLNIASQKSNRSKNKQVQHYLEQMLDDTPRYQLGKDGLCHNGVHLFKSDEVSTKEFCNCGMYVFGELK